MSDHYTEKTRKVDFVTLGFVGLFFVIYFLVPKSSAIKVDGDFRLFSLYLQPWFLQRYFLVALCLGYACLMFVLGNVKLTQRNLLYLILTLLLLTYQFLQGEFVVFYAVTGVVSSYCLIFQVYKREFPKWFLWCAVLAAAAYVCQYFAYRVSVRITSSFLDPNIAGYYLFLCYVVFRAAGIKTLAGIALCCGALSLSRNFYLAVFVFELVNIKYVTVFLKNRLALRSPLIVSIMSLAAILLVSFSIISFSNPNDTIGSTSDRLSNINDGSNYSRSMANIEMLHRLADGDFWLKGLGNEMDLETEHRPHNAFLRAVYRYGMALSVMAFIGFFFVMAYNVAYNYAFFISIFAYYTLLNDFITGPDLTLMLCVGVISHAFKLSRGKEDDI